MPDDLRIFRPAHLPSLELRVGVSHEHIYPRHYHEEVFVTAITGGAGLFNFRGTTHVAGAGSLVTIAPGEVHTHGDPAHGRSFRSMHMPREVYAEIAGQTTLASGLHWEPALHRRFLALHRMLEGSATRLALDAGLLDVFNRLTARRSAPHQRTGESRAVRKAQEIIAARRDGHLTLRELAEATALSPTYFNRVFRRETGMPPHAYQIFLRIQHAKKLVLQKHPLAAVAAAVGFADQAHFTRHFKRLVGVSPSRYL